MENWRNLSQNYHKYFSLTNPLESRSVNTPETFYHHFVKGANFVRKEVASPIFETFHKWGLPEEANVFSLTIATLRSEAKYVHVMLFPLELYHVKSCGSLYHVLFQTAEDT